LKREIVFISYNEYKFIKVDLRYFNQCEAICDGMDYVFNLVGIKGSPKMCAEQPADFMVPMLQFNTNMMEAARRANVKWYLYTSSVGVYAPAEVFKEDDVLNTVPSPNDRFAGWAKRMGEMQAEAYSIQYGWNKVSIVRPANVYGAYDNFNPANAMVVPSLIRKAQENDVLEVWGDGSTIRDFIHADDVALGMLFAVENQITQPINLGSGERYSIKEVVDILAKISGFGTKTLYTGGSKTAVNAISQTTGPSWKMIVSLGDKVEAFGLFPGGESGNPGSFYYDNMVENWAGGKLNSLYFYEKGKPDAKRIKQTISLISKK
jgi:GDP-L-fucose synthase